jgi:carotenoid phi-ring synthase / carotenoid chi-ring synthase
MNRLGTETLTLPIAGGVPRVQTRTRAIVCGGGIAGVAAATILCERGVEVTLVEKETALGGRAGGFPDTLASGERIEMERGFHAFFRQYYNLRALLRRIDPQLALLAPLADYPILGFDGSVQSFRGLPTRTPWQVMALAWRSPHLRMADIMRSNARAALEMLRFDAERTYARFDATSAADYLDSLAFPPAARRMLFDVFSHSFFNPESEMSAAELLMMFHFYFTGNQEGLVFDVARRPLSIGIWRPFAAWLSSRGVRIETGRTVRRVERRVGGGFCVDHDGGRVEAELLVLALDVAALRALGETSPALAPLRSRIAALRVTRPFAVWRLWLDRPVATERAAFAGTTGVGLLDNISVYDRFQDESAAWARAHGGSVVELHGYAVPPDADAASIKMDLRAGLHALYPETRTARVLDERFLLRQDCPAFPPGSHGLRPGVATPMPDLALAGDFVTVPLPCALMERAAVSGMLAANTLLAPLGVAAESIRSVPRRGLFATSGRRRALALLGRALPPAPIVDDRPDWKQASPAWIARALARSQQLPSGGWYVLDASASIGARPRCLWVDGRALVVWRDGSRLRAAPDECPHLGASLAGGCVRDGRLVCPWHGLSLGPEGHGGWRPLPTHDDGVLAWVRLEGEEAPTDAPILPTRPRDPIDVVVRLDAACEPRDVIANRLDPWHGVHYHAHSFGSLRILERQDDAITVRVAYRLLGRLAIEVDARFHCADPRTIVMTIVRGEGEGSVVETHATPCRPGRTTIVEATLASSGRRGFAVARRGAALVRPLMAWGAGRLWQEDARYAERLYALRQGAEHADERYAEASGPQPRPPRAIGIHGVR